MKTVRECWLHATLACIGIASISVVLAALGRGWGRDAGPVEVGPADSFEPSDGSGLARVNAKVQELGPAAIPVLLDDLRAGHADVEATVAGLCWLGPAALPGLLGSWNDDQESVRLAVTRTVVCLGAALEPQGAVVVPGLVQRLDDRSSEVRYAAILALMNFESLGEEPIPGLMAALREADELPATDLTCLQQGAAFVLGKIGPKAEMAVPELTRIFNDANSPARDAAALALWRIRGDMKILQPQLTEMLTGTNFGARMQASTIIDRIVSKSALHRRSAGLMERRASGADTDRRR